MNKHQYRAIAAAVLGIVVSFALWTSIVGKLPLPKFSEAAVSAVEDLLDDLAAVFRTNEETLEVQEVTVEDLGTHFSTTVKHTTVQASVVTHTTETAVEEVQDLPLNSGEEVSIEEPVFEAAPVEPTELDQWELVNAWGISVPSLHIRAPVLLPSMKYWSSQAWDLLEQQMQVGLNHGAVAYPHSASPGTNGSLIVAGHSSPPDDKSAASAFGALFAKLPDIEIGEEIEVSVGGEIVRYKVEAKEVVSPKATSILQQQSDESILKLITCYPVGTTRDRMIITAKKI